VSKSFFTNHNRIRLKNIVMGKLKCNGWISNVKAVYRTFKEFKHYCKLYRIHRQLGYTSIKRCWENNPRMDGTSLL